MTIPPPPQEPQPFPPQPVPGPTPQFPQGRKKPNKLLIGGAIAVAAILGLCCIGGIAAMAKKNPGSGTDESKQDSTASQTEDKDEEALAEPDIAKIGEQVEDGEFAFTVNKLEDGVTEVGGDMLVEEAQGEFLIINLTVENIGDKAQTFFDTNQKLIDTEDKQYDADSEAGLYIEDNDALFEEINPGNKIDVKIVFDLPKDAKPSNLELHESAISGGVEVSLSK